MRARSVIGRAVRAGGEDDAFSAHRHRLLLGWVRMQEGQLGTATADAVSVADASLHRRDALWAARSLNRVGGREDLPLFESREDRASEPDADLPPMLLGEHVVERTAMPR